MSKHRKSKNDFEKKLQDEAQAYEPIFWLIPKWLRIISPLDVATKKELIDLKIEVRRIERLSGSEGAGWFQDTIYSMMMHAWLYIWTALMIALGLVLIIGANVLWFWFLGYLIYIMFFE